MSVKNFVQCSLTTPVAAGSTELILVAPVAPYVLPPADGGVLVIADSMGRPTFVEVIRYTSCSGNVLYGVTRGQEGTPARAWSGPTFIYQALTADEYTVALAGKEPSIVAGTDAQMWLGNKTWASVLSQVQGTLLTGLSLATGTAITAADTVLTGLGKLQKQITDAANNLAGNVRNTAITGYVVGSNTALAAADTVLGALGKIQGQLNGKQASLGYTAENTANKGVANGYAGLDATGKVPAVQLPSFVDDVLEFANLAGFPATGESGKIYVDLATNKSHRWSGSAYVEISASPGSTDAVTEGGSNLYFTEGRVRATLLAGYAVGANAVLAATDTVLGAMGKLQGQMNAKAPLTGAGTSGSWPISVTGNAARARPQRSDNANWDFYWSDPGGQPTYYLGSTDGATVRPYAIGAMTVASCSGNAGTATKLATARTINGVPFDGSVNITIAAGETGRLPLTGGTLTGRLNGTSCGMVGTGNDYNSGAYEVMGNGPSDTVFPTIGFHQPSAYASSLQLRGASDFRFYAHGAAAYANVTANIFYGTLAGNASSATTLAGSQFDWASIRSNAVANMLGWKNYGNGHVIFDASQSTSPSGSAVNNTNSAVAWSAGYPTLMGWNGSTTYGLRVDSARVADGIPWTGVSGKPTTLAGYGITDGYAMNGINTGWFRSSGPQGWFNETFGGGIYMTDATYVRTYNGKQFACNDGIQIDGATPQVRLNDTSWGVRYLYHDAGLIGFLSAAGGWTFHNDNGGNTTAIGNVTAYSDIRLKTDIEVIPDALAKVMKLRGVTYERIDSGERQTGVIAQEVQAVLPEAVMTMTDEQQTLSVAYGNLVGLLIEAIKELKAEVDELKQGAK